MNDEREQASHEIVLPAIIVSTEPTMEEICGRIADELNRPRYAFERTFDGHRYTRMIGRRE